MPELTDAGVPGGSESLLYGEDIFMHMRAFPFGLSFTVIGFTVYVAQGISWGKRGPKHSPSVIQL